MYQFRNIEKADCVSTVCFYFFLGSCLFQLFQNLVRTHAARQQLLQHSLCLGLLSFFSGLSIRLCLLRFQGCHFLFGFLQSSLLLVQCILLLLDCFLDGCDLSIQRCNSLLLLCELGYVVVGGIDFGTVFSVFRSWHGDNLFPF